MKKLHANESVAVSSALAVSELRYRRLFESAKDGILILDAETGIVTDVNPFLCGLLGYPREDMVGKAVWELGFFRDSIANRDKFAELKTREYVRYEDLPLEAADGHRVEVEFISNVYVAGATTVIQCNIRDISLRKKIEAYRRMENEILQILNTQGRSENFLQLILSVLKRRTGLEAVGIRLLDDGDFPYFVQEGLPADFLITENTLLGRGANGGVCRDEDGNPKLECTCGLVLSGKMDPENPLFTHGGSFWTNESATLLEIPSAEDPRWNPRNHCIHAGYASVALVPIRNKVRIVGLLQLNDRRKGCFALETIEALERIAFHIGASLMRKQAEAEVRSGKAFLDCVINAMADPVFVKDEQRRFVLVNEAFCALIGCTKERLLGQDDDSMLPCGQVEIFKKVDAELFATGKKSKNIETISEISTGAVRNIITHKTRYVDPDGKMFLVGLINDITEHLQSEREKESLTDQLRQSQKMEAVGRLAGGVAHDFNNLLMVILGNIEMCQEQVGKDSAIREQLDEAMNAARRSVDITKQLLAFARKQTVQPKVLDLNDTIGDMLRLLQRLIGEDIRLTWRPAANLWNVKIDPTQINQILANLSVNARDAITNVGEIILETHNVRIDADYCAQHAEATPGAYVMLLFSDDGCGMDAETLAKVFEPFFTTKKVGQGTGLGLATVYGIVKQNQGFVNLYSELGKGTTFRIYLPSTNAAVEEPLSANEKAEPQGHGETVLLVEDSKSVRTMCEIYLKALGYDVLSAESTTKAQEMARHEGQHIHLVLTDIVMPEMDGRQLAQRICELQPKAKVLFMSGYPVDVIARHGLLEPDIAFISKPFSRRQLAEKMDEVLKGKCRKQPRRF